MPVRVTEVCDLCDSEEDIQAYTVTPDGVKPWRSLLCPAHRRPMDRYQARGTPIVDSIKGSRTAALDRMVRGLPHPDGAAKARVED